MSDLISRSVLRREILDKMPQGTTRGVFLAFVDEQPIAYDKEKVVEQICSCDGCSSCCSCHEEQKMMECEEYARVYEIVKGGGISE